MKNIHVHIIVAALKANNVPVTTHIYQTCYPDSDTRVDGKHIKQHLSDWLETL